MLDLLVYYFIFSITTALVICKVQWSCFNLLGIERGWTEATSYWASTFILSIMSAPILFPGIILQATLYKETIIAALAETYLGR